MLNLFQHDDFGLKNKGGLHSGGRLFSHPRLSHNVKFMVNAI